MDLPELRHDGNDRLLRQLRRAEGRRGWQRGRADAFVRRALARQHESGDRQARPGCTVGAGVVPEFMPKQNSALVGTTAGRSNDAPRREIDCD